MWGVLALVYVVSYFHRIAPAVLAKDLIGILKQVGAWFRPDEFGTWSGMTQVAGNLGGLLAAAPLALVGIGVVFGAPTAGFLSDRVFRSRRVPYILFTLVYTAVWACVSVPPAGPPRALLGPLCFLVGLTASCFTLTWVLAREVNPPRFSGIATATVNAGGFLGAAVMQNVLGRTLDAHWLGVVENGARRYPAAGYHAAFLTSLGMLGLACVLTLAVTETFGKHASD